MVVRRVRRPVPPAGRSEAAHRGRDRGQAGARAHLFRQQVGLEPPLTCTVRPVASSTSAMSSSRTGSTATAGAARSLKGASWESVSIAASSRTRAGTSTASGRIRSNLPYTAPVGQGADGKASTACRSGRDGRRSMRSPRPSTIALPPCTRKGTSLPSSDAMSARRSAPRPRPKRSSSPRSMAAASLEPPPSPPPTGIRFSSFMRTGSLRPAARSSARCARTARSFMTGQSMSVGRGASGAQTMA